MFAKGDVAFILLHISEDMAWEMVGNRTVKGKDPIRDFLMEISSNVADSLTIHSIITHGREASCNGKLSFPGGQVFAFCDVYHFSDTKNNIIKKMESYGISV